MTLIAGSGAGEPPVVGLPTIQNLRSEIVNFTTLIKWDIAEEEIADGCVFGVWFSPTSPVDTSGAPTMTLPSVSGQGTYQVARQQTEAEYVAVRVYTADESGEVGEVKLLWESGQPNSPADQLSK